MARPSQQPRLSFTTPPSYLLRSPHSREYSISSPNLLPSPLIPRRPSASSQSDFRCTGCGKTFTSPCFTVGRRLRAVCRECWKWMWNVSICWSCGEVVYRKTDAIGFGWCWWHWSCFSCLVCSVSERPCHEKLKSLDRTVPAASSKLSRLRAPTTRRRYYGYGAAYLRPLHRLARFNCEA